MRRATYLPAQAYGWAFTRFAKTEGITDAKLLAAVREVEQGLVDADLGGGLIKQRIARPGKGKSGGYRIVIVYRKGDKAFFVHGFAKMHAPI